MTALAALPADIAAELALLLRATLLIGAAWAAAAALRKAGASASARHIVWLLAIAALLALPLLWWLVPALRLPVLPAQAAAGAGSAAAMAQPSALPTGSTTPDEPVQAVWKLVLLAVYGLGAAALLLRLLAGRRMLKRLWSEAGPLKDPCWETLLSRLSSEMRLSRPVELRMSSASPVPMTWGTLAPKVLLPAEASEWPMQRRRLVLLHELAHVARRDSFARSAASIACALYWFHPGAWFAARRMRIEQEHAADDRVLMAGGSPRAYALSLLHLAAGPTARPCFDQAAAMAGMDQLERRLISITSAGRRSRPGTVFVSSAALLAGLTTFLVASGVPVSASATLPGPLQERRVVDSSAEKDADSALAKGWLTNARRGAKLASAPAASGDAVERSASELAVAARPRRHGPDPEASEIAHTGASGGSTAPNPAREESRDRPQPALAQQVRDYGWELPRSGAGSAAAPAAASPRAGRLTLPAPRDSAPSERMGRPRWARNVPRLVHGGTPTSSPVPTSQGPLMLSWSIEVGGK